MTNIEIIVNALLDNGVIEEEKALELIEEEELKNYKSFEEWKRLGFSVKKGEHRLASCRIWRPEEVENEDGSKGTNFVKRWANIFSKKQVEKTADRKARRALEKANAQKTEEPKKAEESKTNSQKAKKAEPKAKKELANAKTETPKVEPKKNSQKAVTKTAKTSKTNSQTAKATKKLENTNKAKAVKNTKKVTKKAEVGVMTSTIEDGIEIIRIDLTKEDGNKAWIKLTKDFYMGLSKTKKRELEKVWGLA